LDDVLSSCSTGTGAKEKQARSTIPFIAIIATGESIHMVVLYLLTYDMIYTMQWYH
jgi:hypothetical protein